MARIGLLAAERVEVPLELEAMLRRRFGRGRRAAHRDDGLERGIAAIGHRQRVGLELVLGEAPVERTLLPAVIDGEADILLAQRPGRQHEPCLFLRRGVAHLVARGFDALGAADQDQLGRVAFGRQGDHRRRIAQRRAVIDAAALVSGIAGQVRRARPGTPCRT